MSKAKIEVDISECYDRLSILQIKVKSNLTKSSSLDSINQLKLLGAQIDHLEEEVSIAIGRELAEKIYKSKEYKSLYLTNGRIFDLIDQVKFENSIGKMVDNENHNRFLCKKSLQEAFFSKAPEEIKIGYE